MKIGVFDSGVGGLSVASAIQKELPEHEVVLVEDKENVPYGTKSPEQLLKLVLPLLIDLQSQECDAIVIACNTVSTTLIDKIREELVIPVIGMEPMVKPAAGLSKSGVIAVCATPTTLASERYRWLKDTYAKHVTVIEPDCSDWARMIESNEIDRKEIRNSIESVCDQGADVIVLGCTHYHWIEEIIAEIAADRAVVLQPEQPVVAQLTRVLAQLA